MSLLLIQAMEAQSRNSVYSARSSSVCVDEFDVVIHNEQSTSSESNLSQVGNVTSMKAQSRKERDELDEFINVLKSPTQEYSTFLTILATPSGMSNSTMLPSERVEEETEIEAFASFLKGGSLPPRSIKKSRGLSSGDCK
jgi:hypothetical protein